MQDYDLYDLTTVLSKQSDTNLQEETTTNWVDAQTRTTRSSKSGRAIQIIKNNGISGIMSVFDTNHSRKKSGSGGS